MGTIVLSPQDCLLSPHNRRNHYFPSMAYSTPKGGSRSSQALMVPSPPADDCARQNYTGGSPAGDGLLPSPQPHGQARTFSKKSPLTKPSSPFNTPPPPRTVSTPFKLSRSASAILPKPLSSSPPFSDGDRLQRRLRMKNVQGNGPGSDEHQNLPFLKKPADTRHGVRTSGHIGNEKMKEFSEALKPRNGEGQKRRFLKKSDSTKGVGSMSSQFDVPVVTILQRPKNKEAAAELIAKFFQKSSEQETDNEMFELADNSDRIATDSATEQSASRLSDCEISEMSDVDVGLTESTVTSPVSDSPVDKSIVGFRVVEAASLNLPSFPVDEPVMEETVKALILGPDCEDLSIWERWAGPSYINSPPPSALPLPHFSKKHAECESLAATDRVGIADQISPFEISSPLFTTFSEPGGQMAAVAAATKDLRRILNLNSCRM